MPDLQIVMIRDESGGFTVNVPELPGCVTHGNTIDEALGHVREAVRLYLDGETADSLRAAGVRPAVVDAVLAVPA